MLSNATIRPCTCAASHNTNLSGMRGAPAALHVTDPPDMHGAIRGRRAAQKTLDAGADSRCCL